MRNQVTVPALDFDIRSSTTAAAALRVSRARTPAARHEDPVRAAREFLRSNRSSLGFSSADIDGLALVQNQALGPNARIVSLRQTLESGRLPVFQGIVKVLVRTGGEGRVLQVAMGNGVTPGAAAAAAGSAGISDEAAVRRVLEIHGYAKDTGLMRRSDSPGGRIRYFSPFGLDHSDITAERVAFPLTPGGEVVVAWRVLLEIDGTQWYEVLVDASSGRLLYRRNLYNYAAQGRVWPKNPIAGPRTIVEFPVPWLAPDGRTTTGNNVDAYLDVFGSNTPSAVSALDVLNGRPYSATQNFDFGAGEGTTLQNPRDYRAAAVTNLFYFVNAAHDYFYRLGFTEEAGNFQQDNFGRGGAAGDRVLAEAQDARMEGNASMATPPDGVSPRLQMGLFRGVDPYDLYDDLDSAYDGQIVFHEYAHGVANRLVGGPEEVSCLRGKQSRAMAEGWSDYFAMSYFDTPVVGAYVSQNEFRGSRSQSYANNRLTYQDLGNNGLDIYEDGSIWGAMLWDLRQTLGRETADALVVAGMKLTPCSPSMVDGRDAILAADAALFDSSHEEALWQVFAYHGFGESASGQDGGSLEATVANASWDLPARYRGPGSNANPVVRSRPPVRLQAGQKFTYQVTASDPDGGKLSYELRNGPEGMVIDGSTGLVSWPSVSFVGRMARVLVTDGQGGITSHNFEMLVDTELTSGNKVVINGPVGRSGWAGMEVPENTSVLQIRLRGGVGDTDMALYGPDGVLYGVSARDFANETLSVSKPAAGRWVVQVYGYRWYAGVTLTGERLTPREIPAGGSLPGIAGDDTSESFFRIAVPEKASALTVTGGGVSGTPPVMLLQEGLPPVCQGSSYVTAPCDYDRRIMLPGSTRIPTPPAGDYFVSLYHNGSFSGLTLSSLITAGSLTVSPLTLDPATPIMIEMAQGSGKSESRTIRVAVAPEDAGLAWLAMVSTSGGGSRWLSVLEPASGKGNGAVTAVIDPGALAAGTYAGSITFQTPAVSAPPRSVPVRLTIAEAPGRRANLQLIPTATRIQRSADGSWTFILGVRETHGVGFTITGLSVLGAPDAGAGFENYFGSSRIEPYGQVRGMFRYACSTCTTMTEYRIRLTGDDDAGNKGISFETVVQLYP